MKIPQNIAYSLAFVFLFLGSAATVMAVEENKETGAVAQVNDHPISRKDFDYAMQATKQQYTASGGQEGEPEQLLKLQNLTLDRLIDFELLYQTSQKEHITVDEATIDAKMSAFRKQFPADAAFQVFMQSNGLTEEVMTSQLRRKLAIEGLQQKLYNQFASATTATKEELRQFYDANQESIKAPEKVRASHILVTVEATADDAARKAALAKITAIQQQLQEGGDFAKLAQEHSDCPSKTNGGDLDFFARAQMVKPFADAAFTTPVGQTSDIVTTEFGYHLIKVTDNQAARLLAFDEVREKISSYLTQQKIDAQFDAYMNDLHKQATIKRMLPTQNS